VTLRASYHCHSNWSDGSASVAEVVGAAREAGLAQIAMTDHYTPLPGGGTVEWSMGPRCVEPYAESVWTVREAEAEIEVLLGIEADFFPETVGALRERLGPLPFDLVIGSVHFVDDFAIDEPEGWPDLSEPERVGVWRGYWERIAQLAASDAFDIVGHLDLPKLFGGRAPLELAELEDAALDAIAEADMAIELNTAGVDKAPRQPYPSLRLLRAARERDIPLVITADAHAPSQVTRHFPRAAELARHAGYTQLATYRSRVRGSTPLAHEPVPPLPRSSRSL
jgi:histidinol-phosphatase (PHP family)